MRYVDCLARVLDLRNEFSAAVFDVVANKDSHCLAPVQESWNVVEKPSSARTNLTLADRRCAIMRTIVKPRPCPPIAMDLLSSLMTSRRSNGSKSLGASGT